MGVLSAFGFICIVIQIRKLHVGIILLPDVVDHPRCGVSRHRVDQVKIRVSWFGYIYSSIDNSPKIC